MSRCPFATLGLPVVFALDKEGLDKEFRHRQAALHPDCLPFSSSPSSLSQNISEDTLSSLDLTKAYQILKNPQQRAAAFLTAKGVDIPGKEGRTVGSSLLLREVLEWQHQMEEKENWDALEASLAQRLAECMYKMDHAPIDQLPNSYLELVYLLKTQGDLQARRRTDSALSP